MEVRLESMGEGSLAQPDLNTLAPSATRIGGPMQARTRGLAFIVTIANWVTLLAITDPRRCRCYL